MCSVHSPWMRLGLIGCLGFLGIFLAQPVWSQTKPVMVYGVIHEYTLARLMQKFERDTGTKADFIRLSAGEVATRVLAEKQAPKGIAPARIEGGGPPYNFRRPESFGEGALEGVF